MTTSIIFEVRESDPETSMAQLLAEVASMNEYDTRRRRITAAVAMWWATQELEACAIIEADHERELRRRERRAAARALKSDAAPEDEPA